MKPDRDDRIKSLVLGMGLPLAIVSVVIPLLLGHPTQTRHGTIYPPHGRGLGLLFVGMALFIHVCFYHCYDNHPKLKWGVVVLGVLVIVVGCWILVI